MASEDGWTDAKKKRKRGQIFRNGVLQLETFTRLGKKIPRFLKPVKDEVFVFWDFDSTRIPGTYDLSEFVKKIEEALRLHKRSLTVAGGMVFGDFNYSRTCMHQMNGLKEVTQCEFGAFHVEKRIMTCHGCGAKTVYQSDPNQREIPCITEKQLKSDLPHITLKTMMILKAIDADEVKIKLLIITSDSGFATTIASLKERGHKVYVACKADADPILKTRAEESWIWENLYSGGAPIPKPTNVSSAERNG